jgi:hypothetical protein
MGFFKVGKKEVPEPRFLNIGQCRWPVNTTIKYIEVFLVQAKFG